MNIMGLVTMIKKVTITITAKFQISYTSQGKRSAYQRQFNYDPQMV